MPDTEMLDLAFHTIMNRVLADGFAPHYVDLAVELNTDVEETRQAVHDIMAAGVPGWVHPGTDYIASFPPFNNQPTQYRVEADGHPPWFAQ